ncbi:MAG: hypothetical protein AB7E76_13355 [Deferribacterales bacterium]|jgi:hypothetical protein
MLNLNFLTETDERKIKQLTGIANLHISIAREIMSSDKPLTREELQSMLELLVMANEARRLAQKIKTDIETQETA